MFATKTKMAPVSASRWQLRPDGATERIMGVTAGFNLASFGLVAQATLRMTCDTMAADAQAGREHALAAARTAAGKVLDADPQVAQFRKVLAQQADAQAKATEQRQRILDAIAKRQAERAEAISTTPDDLVTKLRTIDDDLGTLTAGLGTVDRDVQALAPAVARLRDAVNAGAVVEARGKASRVVSGLQNRRAELVDQLTAAVSPILSELVSVDAAIESMNPSALVRLVDIMIGTKG